jgi:hypothetical protein
MIRCATQSITPTLGFSANNRDDEMAFQGSSTGKQQRLDKNLKNIGKLDYSVIDKKNSVILS